jgi:hypothetical protein
VGEGDETGIAHLAPWGVGSLEEGRGDGSLLQHCRAMPGINYLQLIARRKDEGNMESGIILTLDPGWKSLDLGSRINIPDPQHFFLYIFTLIKQTYNIYTYYS